MVKSLDAWMTAWVMSVASICFDSLVRRSALELCLFPPMDCTVRWMTSWLPMDELLRSGNRPKPQHWKSDESTEAEETSAEEDQDWNDDSDADWTMDSEGRSSLSGGSVCALVASGGQASLRRSISETDLLVSEEEVNQTFACWKEVLQRFCVALTTRLESDADVPLRWRRQFEFHDHRETRIRATVQVVFADVVDSHRAQQELIELLSRVRDRWWLRLSPEDVDAHNESFMDPQAFLELPCPVRRQMHAERAFVCLEQPF